MWCTPVDVDYWIRLVVRYEGDIRSDRSAIAVGFHSLCKLGVCVK